jgi:ubiquinone/menaquinone biosynthesis C-methylase UbiE
MADAQHRQRELFLREEGDAWFARNKHASEDRIAEYYLRALADMPTKPGRILEIGCGEGRKLERLQQEFCHEAYGIEPSSAAVKAGNTRCAALRLQAGTADALPFASGFFDVVIFGFCLYLCDRELLFTIASETDRVLKAPGRLIILDFYPPFPYRNTYAHKEGIFSYKMDHATMFLWNPAYTLISHSALSHAADAFHDDPDERLAVSVLTKLSADCAFLTDPYR